MKLLKRSEDISLRYLFLRGEKEIERRGKGEKERKKKEEEKREEGGENGGEGEEGGKRRGGGRKSHIGGHGLLFPHFQEVYMYFLL